MNFDGTRQNYSKGAEDRDSGVPGGFDGLRSSKRPKGEAVGSGDVLGTEGDTNGGLVGDVTYSGRPLVLTGVGDKDRVGEEVSEGPRNPEEGRGRQRSIGPGLKVGGLVLTFEYTPPDPVPWSLVRVQGPGSSPPCRSRISTKRMG